MTWTTDNNYHFIKVSCTIGPDAPQIDYKQTEKLIRGPQAVKDASLVAPTQSTRNENAANTKKRRRRKANSPTSEVQPLSATLRLNKNNRMLYIPLQFNYYEISFLLATGAIQKTLSENELRCITTTHPSALLDELQAPDYRIPIANGYIGPVRKQILLRFFLAGLIFEEQIMVLPTMGNINIGMSFFQNMATLDLKKPSSFPGSGTAASTQTREIQMRSVWTQGHTESSYRSLSISDGLNGRRCRTWDINRHYRSATIIFAKFQPHRDTITQPTTTRPQDNSSYEP